MKARTSPAAERKTPRCKFGLFRLLYTCLVCLCACISLVCVLCLYKSGLCACACISLVFLGCRNTHMRTCTFLAYAHISHESCVHNFNMCDCIDGLWRPRLYRCRKHRQCRRSQCCKLLAVWLLDLLPCVCCVFFQMPPISHTLFF